MSKYKIDVWEYADTFKNLDTHETFGGEQVCKLLEQKDQQISDLQHEKEVIQKALELACERVKYFEEMQDKEMGFYEFFGYDSDYDLKAIIEQYKQQAKEMLGNE